MDRTATTHASHDQLLLARLYGGDVDEAERTRALDQMASCQDCADLFADLGAIADATAALPVPPRPRDFTLTEADVTRLRRRRINWSISGWFGRTRALGGSMVAAGIVGLLVLGAVSVFAPGGGADRSSLTSVGAPAADTSGSGAEYAVPSAAAPDGTDPGRKSTGGTTIGLAGSPGPSAELPDHVAASPEPVSNLSVPPAGPTAAPQPAATGAGAPGAGPDTQGAGAVGPSAAPSGGSYVAAVSASGFDARFLALAGLLGLLALGLLLLIGTRLAARRAPR